MSWIDPEPRRRPWAVRLLFALLRRRRGGVSEPVRLWARSPRLVGLFLAFWRALDRRRSPIPAELRSLVQVRISQLNVCAFCVDLTGSHALERGAGEAKLLAVDAFETSPLFQERERAALAYAEAVTITGRKVTEELRARLRAAFDDDGIVELTALIAFQNMSSKFNFALDVPAQGFCGVPVPRAGSVAPAEVGG